MTLDDLHPFVVPHVPDLPTPVVELAMRRAARDFFRRTHAWQSILDPIPTVEGTVEYDAPGPTGTEVVKLLEAVVDGDDYAKAVRYADGATIRFHENDAPRGGTELLVTLAVAPKVGSLLASWSIPATLDEFAEDISNGALSMLLAPMKGRKEDAAMYAALFSNRINVVGIKVSRQFAARRLTRSNTVQFF